MKKKKLCGAGITPKIPTGNNLGRPFGGGGAGGGCVGPARCTSGGGANEAAAAAVVDTTDCDEYHPLLSSPSRFGAQNHANNPQPRTIFDSYSTDTYNYSGETVPSFTSAQWKELERQAMIYKYMISSEPVPLHLLYPSTSPMFNVGYTKSGAAVELGRCKRTDGKKWRCSRDVAPHQKYCERHLHRGRPRSRKPVEFDTSNIINGDDTIKKPRIEKTYQTLSSFDEKIDPNGIATTSLDRKMNGELGLIMENKVSSNYISNALFNQMDHHMLSSSDFPIHFLGAWPMDNPYGNINNLNKYSSQLVQNEELSPWPNFSMELAGAPVLDQGIADGGTMDGVKFYDEGVQWSGPVCYSEPFGPGGPLAEALCLNPTSLHDSMGGLGTAFSSPSGVNERRLFLQFDGGTG